MARAVATALAALGPTYGTSIGHFAGRVKDIGLDARDLRPGEEPGVA
jgi:hypothetical protein